jgi:hypothetical protein
MSKNSLLIFIIFWFCLIYIAKSQELTTTLTCKGPISFSLSPIRGYAGDTITASVSDLKGGNCLNKRVYIKESNCQGLQYCSCIPNSLSIESYGCVCTFRAPTPPYVSGKESNNQIFTYYACVDANGNGIYDENLDEKAQSSIVIYNRYAPLSFMTESIIVIITIGVLLSIIIVVFRMSIKRR